ncbi:trigger factor [Abyssibacter profundi]|uniref:Trigger factor n=1 Tax=Abyssibacter profundi TaxID=2182787 RepID=A0A363UN07_9GAMM|nr:trigger factor [Abyssibacter profundi]PWN56809.1 trigger factor [Abyssibacter profundi]
MEVSVEQSEGLRRRLSVEIPADQLEQAFSTRIKQMGQRAKVPGFRPGKVPTKVLVQRYGDAARAEAVEELLRTTYPKAIEESELKPAGYPTFDIQAEVVGEPLKYTASFEVYPEVTLTGLDGLKVERPQVEIGEDDVERTLGTIKEQHRKWVAVDRPAAKGDKMKLDFVGKLDGEAFEGGAAEAAEVELGAGRFIPSMEEALVGLTAGTETTIDVSFPDDYQAENLKGKDTQFEVKILSVEAGEDPALDDPELLKSLGVEESAGEAGLRAKVREQLERERDKAVSGKVKEQVMDGLLAANPIDVPQAMVDEEIQRMRQEAVQRFGNMPNNDPDAMARMLPDDLFKDNATKRVALSLLISEVIQEKQVKVEEEDIDAVLARYASELADTEQAMQYYRSQPQIMQQFQALAMEERVVDVLLEGATVTDQSVTFDDLMNPNNETAE